MVISCLCFLDSNYMCLSPVTIINPSKYVSVHYRDRFLLQVPCNRCAECQQNKSNEYLFRTYHEFLRCLVNSDNFVYFDTLTYDNKNLPHLNEVVKQLPNYPCFRPSDITKFLKRLRITCERKFGDVSFRYFLCSEYGSKFGRPHYHVIFFVYGKISPFEFSRLVSSCWKLGRTDGIPYQNSLYVMQHNVIKASSVGQLLRVSNYVTKYVQKDCAFQKVLDSRLRKVDEVLDSDIVDGKLKLNGVKLERLREKVKRSVNQFHLQSLHYGENALSDFDLNQISLDGYLLMPHFKIVKMPIAIPTYYKRKLFYDLYDFLGSKTWVLNHDGKRYKKIRDSKNVEVLAARLRCYGLLGNCNYDWYGLADYVLHCRGRYKAERPESTIIDRAESLTHYVYVTRSDKENVGIGVTENFVGNTSVGYVPLTNKIRIKDFIDKYVFLDEEKEVILSKLYSLIEPLSIGKEAAFELEQRLRSLYKSVGKGEF